MWALHQLQDLREVRHERLPSEFVWCTNCTLNISNLSVSWKIYFPVPSLQLFILDVDADSTQSQADSMAGIKSVEFV